MRSNASRFSSSLSANERSRYSFSPMSRVAFRAANAAALARPSLGSNPKSPSSSSALLFSSPIPSVCDAPRSNRVSSVFFVARNDDAKRAFESEGNRVIRRRTGGTRDVTAPRRSTSRVLARTGTGRLSPLPPPPSPRPRAPASASVPPPSRWLCATTSPGASRTTRSAARRTLLPARARIRTPEIGELRPYALRRARRALALRDARGVRLVRPRLLQRRERDVRHGARRGAGPPSAWYLRRTGVAMMGGSSTACSFTSSRCRAASLSTSSSLCFCAARLVKAGRRHRRGPRRGAGARVQEPREGGLKNVIFDGVSVSSASSRSPRSARSTLARAAPARRAARRAVSPSRDRPLRRPTC